MYTTKRQSVELERRHDVRTSMYGVTVAAFCCILHLTISRGIFGRTIKQWGTGECTPPPSLVSP
ncbi:hypothetical protein BO82DRAFT_141363 [Aspergillus uvarum CBS 121591]|uniref:Uncharacterized protein n=1 Tax=Aspergillus uvarum CBS 121591 TaxID=1448315 RepID=A0A319E475_9EURO|nr:hypothetical protein BO82DRAFT_141363 [Aspergillus uvarum CBS 121591]PYH85892.1 hypothetical protein BO82DRAFT_141363 [Aspergillus uvarum CBS 121591]